ncbi:hypothetical protein KR51_00019010 [Rubidibacter lacunae KORDI 51-2]|uniref:Uncharacterized protein n=1 Tax=Rubidibacter lacunae KORDI 51-2 TaxID=582515 RepID=U5DL82_9CHRO|nr:hypothetical protein [Rubidibacter lacunae]ERN41334.1 hypothetical protein KR51_00019010 [Rubidibacter lacunae KORDI 51-2]
MLAARRLKTRSLLVVAVVAAALVLWQWRYWMLALGGVAIALTWRG